MLDLSPRSRLAIGIALALLMAVTRGHHFSDINLPSASWAVFFLAGVLLPARWAFPALFLEAVALDLAAVTWGGVSNWCVTPAYGLLLPAYAALWLGGRLYARVHQEGWATLGRLLTCLLGASSVCHLLSSGGFYFFSGRYPDASLAGFLPRIAAYYPQSLQALALYVGLAALLLAAGHAWTQRSSAEVSR
ncbi:hypothetical protein KRX52_08485 [Pseudomonas sp. MAP12]|uniref:Cobalamin ABC transporter n=1 Tax=Geopseudomonas aromaticivorans TaxID=2849492 RepID=A0ABS6MVR2_9GAMM|nr:hypothetical protein [Pseudomonas aromaticivorans]MBV2132835.1 hypothetical protein [Pseudomonas aromaticivorans]